MINLITHIRNTQYGMGQSRILDISKEEPVEWPYQVNGVICSRIQGEKNGISDSRQIAKKKTPSAAKSNQTNKNTLRSGHAMQHLEGCITRLVD
jgi:hypothetical protein